MSRPSEPELYSQALRLPEHTRAYISDFAEKLHDAGCDVTAAQVARGLCRLALDLALGNAGVVVAGVFRLVAGCPTARHVRSAFGTLVWLCNVKPCTTPRFVDAPADVPPPALKRTRQDLHNQALRLTRDMRARLEFLATEIKGAGVDVTAAEVTRGLCLLAVEILHGAADTHVAKAFRIAASDPTEEGARKALMAVQSLVDGDPPTGPESVVDCDPPRIPESAVDCEAPTRPVMDWTPPSSSPISEAA